MVAADAMPTYDAKADTNDVAILTLQAPGLTFTSHVDAIGLVPSGAAPVPGRALDVSGYGTTAYRGPRRRRSRRRPSTRSTTTRCVSGYAITWLEIARKDLVVCAGAPGRDSCQGDSGSRWSRSAPRRCWSAS